MSNWSELFSVLFSVQTAALDNLYGKAVLVETNNATTMAYVDHMGRQYPMLGNLAERLLGRCL